MNTLAQCRPVSGFVTNCCRDLKNLEPVPHCIEKDFRTRPHSLFARTDKRKSFLVICAKTALSIRYILAAHASDEPRYGSNSRLSYLRHATIIVLCRESSSNNYVSVTIDQRSYQGGDFAWVVLTITVDSNKNIIPTTSCSFQYSSDSSTVSHIALMSNDIASEVFRYSARIIGGPIVAYDKIVTVTLCINYHFGNVSFSIVSRYPDRNGGFAPKLGWYGLGCQGGRTIR